MAVLDGAGPRGAAEEETSEPDPARLRHGLHLQRPFALLHQPALPAPDHQPSEKTHQLLRRPGGQRPGRQEEACVELQAAGGRHLQVPEQLGGAAAAGVGVSAAGAGVRQGGGRQRAGLGAVGPGPAHQPRPRPRPRGRVAHAVQLSDAASAQQEHGLLSVS